MNNVRVSSGHKRGHPCPGLFIARTLRACSRSILRNPRAARSSVLRNPRAGVGERGEIVDDGEKL